MKNKINLITLIVIAFVTLSFTFASWTKADEEYSQSERREIAQKPTLSAQTILSGDFMSDFEHYKVDQFPLRDKLRGIKALFSRYIFNKKDNNGLYSADGHLSKIEYPLNNQMVEYAKNKFDYIYNTYLKDNDVNIYLSLVPDKNYFLAEKNGYLSIDYDSFIRDFTNKMDYMTYINIFDKLSIDDYYTTDSHWKQENITDVAEFIANSMGTNAKSEYTINTLDNPFNGVYLGQSALPFKSDTIKYLTNDMLDNCVVTYYDTGSPLKGEMYNMKKAYGKDPYEMFLSGTSSLITIENPDASSDKELVIFRDSFAGAIAPLLSQAYSKITLVDIRYIQSAFVGNFVDFDKQDVLFLYSTTLINNSTAMR